MVDEEKKPRHRLGADELLEETNGAVAKVVNLLSSNGLATDSVQHLTSLARALDFMGTLDLARNLALSMPDVPHEELVVLLLDAWDCIVYRTGNLRKQMYRKVRLLEGDNKTETDVLERWKGERDKAERESAKANVAYVTMREIVKSFKAEANDEQQGKPPEAAIQDDV